MPVGCSGLRPLPVTARSARPQSAAVIGTLSPSGAATDRPAAAGLTRLPSALPPRLHAVPVTSVVCRCCCCCTGAHNVVATKQSRFSSSRSRPRAQRHTNCGCQARRTPRVGAACRVRWVAHARGCVRRQPFQARPRRLRGHMGRVAIATGTATGRPAGAVASAATSASRPRVSAVPAVRSTAAGAVRSGAVSDTAAAGSRTGSVTRAADTTPSVRPGRS